MKTLFVINNTWTFRTDWSKLVSPNYYLLLVTSPKGFKKLDDKQKKSFYKIILTDKFSVEQLTSILQTAAYENEEINLNNAKLATTDERLTYVTAQVRQKLKIPGDAPQIIERFRDKVIMKNYLANKNINLPNFLLFNPDLYKNYSKNYLRHLEKQIGYPMIIKPTDAGGSRGVVAIKNNKELTQWASKYGASAINYEVDQMIPGKLYHADMIVHKGNIIKTFVCEHYLPNDIALKTGQPIANIVLPENEEKFIEYSQYARSVLKAMAPYPQNCVFDLDFFVNTQGQCVFIEIACRSPGGMMASMYQKICGINIEEMHFRLQFQLPIPTLKAQYQQHVAYFWIPRKEGVVSQLHYPQINSQMALKWHVKPGDQLTKAQGMSDIVTSILLTNKNFATLNKDYQTLCNFKYCSMKPPQNRWYPYINRHKKTIMTISAMSLTSYIVWNYFKPQKPITTPMANNNNNTPALK